MTIGGATGTIGGLIAGVLVVGGFVGFYSALKFRRSNPRQNKEAANGSGPLSGRGQKTMAEDGLHQMVASEIDAFDKATLDAIAISESRIGVDHTDRQNTALFIFAKLIAHCMSMRLIVGNYHQVLESGGLLDHSSLAALGRTAIDAALMTMYISDPNIKREEWNLRQQILWLHELFNRKRFLASAGETGVPFFETYEQRKRELRSRISKQAMELGRATGKIESMLKGQNVYIDGAKAATREAGWDLNQFDFYQSYFSNWVHSHPVTFLRADEQKLSFSHPSAFQIRVCGTVLEAATLYLVATTERMRAFTGAKSLDAIGHLDRRAGADDT